MLNVGATRRHDPIGSIVEETVGPSRGDGFHAGMDFQRLQDPANVISDGLPAQVEELSNLVRRGAVGEQAENLMLARRELRVRPRRLGRGRRP